MIQMLGVMENLWKCENLDLRMTRYQASKITQLKRKQKVKHLLSVHVCQVVPTEHDKGVLELVQEADTVCK